MKILYHHRVAAGDGQRVHITEMIRAFRSLGHDVIVVGPRFAAKNYDAKKGLVGWLRLALPAFLGELFEIAYSIRAYLKLRRAIRTYQPDALYERANLFLWAGKWAASKAKIPYILEVNAPLAVERAKNGSLQLQQFAKNAEYAMWRAADACLPVSVYLGGLMEAEGVKRNRIHPIHNGVNMSDYPEPVSRNADKRVRIGFIGFVRDWHRLDRVIALLNNAAFRDVELEIVGDGPALKALKDQTHKEKLTDRVRFLGIAKREDVPSILSSWDIALQPGVTDYASPLKLFEYMAAGLAIIAPDQANIREVLTDGESALLVTQKQTELEDALIKLVNDTALRQQIGKRARALVVKTPYTWENNAARVTKIIDDLSTDTIK